MRIARHICLLSILACQACGGSSAPAGQGDGNTAVDSGVVKPDGNGASGAPLVPCSGDAVATTGDHHYACGSCGPDAFYSVVCSSGYLSCPSSAGSSMYVVDMNDYENMTGQCSYIAPAYEPGFGIADPVQAITTVRDPGRPLALKATNPLGRPPYTFAAILQDRTLGEKAIRSLVTVTDMTSNTPIEYAIGNPVKSAADNAETLTLTPLNPLAANTWYRVTLYPAETQQFLKCHTYGRRSSELSVPEATDFYTYSRPTIGEMFVAYKDGTKGYLDFLFTEPLLLSDLGANPAAVVAVDGAVLSGCMMPYACSGSSAQQSYDLRLDLAVVPTSFSEIALRIPHAVKSVDGGTVLGGTKDNPFAVVDGDWAVYTFKASDMILTDNNRVKHWYYTGK
jgi:hypothetical protein